MQFLCQKKDLRKCKESHKQLAKILCLKVNKNSNREEENAQILIKSNVELKQLHKSIRLILFKDVLRLQ